MSQQDTIDEKDTKKRSMNPVRAVTRGVSQGTQVVRGGISQVEKGVGNVGNIVSKVPGVKHGVSFFADYRKFMDRGNVIDLAVAVVIGAAFTAIVTSLVTDIITPIIALASGKNLEENFIILRHNKTSVMTDYPTRAIAQADGNITWNWGNFIQTVINFFIISGCVFLIIKLYQVGRNTKTEVTEKSCDYCLTKVPLNAVRCPECTTWLDWDACTKAAQMERIAAAGALNNPATIDSPYVDGEFEQEQASLGRF
ncbi:large-conductance mechanosensitive channel [Dissophora ornata]|nr:hypothetical protein BGZ58_003762 [Dissophora ornata]KAI8605177.1 large-conductance mechanosensitive channel [Dissophora ornata]